MFATVYMLDQTIFYHALQEIIWQVTGNVMVVADWARVMGHLGCIIATFARIGAWKWSFPGILGNYTGPTHGPTD